METVILFVFAFPVSQKLTEKQGDEKISNIYWSL